MQVKFAGACFNSFGLCLRPIHTIFLCMWIRQSRTRRMTFLFQTVLIPARDQNWKWICTSVVDNFLRGVYTVQAKQVLNGPDHKRFLKKVVKLCEFIYCRVFLPFCLCVLLAYLQFIFLAINKLLLFSYIKNVKPVFWQNQNIELSKLNFREHFWEFRPAEDLSLHVQICAVCGR